jgi:hypothetical protein
MMRTATTSIHLRTAGEGRYLKAYLEWAAGRREVAPSPWHFNLSDRPDRVERINDYAHSLIEALIKEQV